MLFPSSYWSSDQERIGEFPTPESVKRLVRVRDCGIVWVDAPTNKCIFRHLF